MPIDQHGHKPPDILFLKANWPRVSPEMEYVFGTPDWLKQWESQQIAIHAAELDKKFADIGERHEPNHE